MEIKTVRLYEVIDKIKEQCAYEKELAKNKYRRRIVKALNAAHAAESKKVSKIPRDKLPSVFLERKRLHDEKLAMAKNSLAKVLGKSGEYTYKDAVQLLKTMYDACEIGFPDFLDYVPSLCHLGIDIPENADKEIDLVWYITDCYCTCENTEIYLLPPRGERLIDTAPLKNGLLVFLCKKGEKLSACCYSGTSEGYRKETELYYHLEVLSKKQ